MADATTTHRGYIKPELHPNMLRALQVGRTRRWPKRTVADRFWPKLDRPNAEACWNWQGALNSSGYGSFKNAQNRVIAAHRAAYELHHGVTLTSGQHVLHRCDNRRCCNPSHLRIGTNADNVADRVAKGRSARPAKLTWDGVRAIRQLSSEGMTNRAIARVIGISESRVSEIKNRKCWVSQTECEA